MAEELISKKELLKITGISYGQLYRWKRQNLIPENWFIKQSSFTGQETFFPRDKILERVNQIMDLKDRYSLEELANLFSPQVKGTFYRQEDLAKLQDFNQEVTNDFIAVVRKDSLTFTEILFIYILSKLKSHYNLSKSDLEDMIISIQSWLPKLRTTSYRFVVCQRQSQTFSLLLQQDAQLYLDHKLSELHVYELDELAKELNLKLNNVLEETHES